MSRVVEGGLGNARGAVIPIWADQALVANTNDGLKMSEVGQFKKRKKTYVVAAITDGSMVNVTSSFA
jgi:hypothetical protein